MAQEVIKPGFHRSTEVSNIERAQLFPIDEEALSNGWWNKRFHPRPDDLFFVFTAFNLQNSTVDVEVEIRCNFMRVWVNPILAGYRD